METVSATGHLESLFAEVNALATHLRLGRSITESDDRFSGGVCGVLQALGGAEPQTVPNIARLRGTSRQNIQVVVNRLKITGLVQSEGNPAHKRSTLVRLTEKGKAALVQIQQTESRRLGSLLTQVPQEELVSTMGILSKLRQLLASGAASEFRRKPRKQPAAISAKAASSPAPRQPPRALVAEDSQPEEDAFPLNLL